MGTHIAREPVLSKLERIYNSWEERFPRLGATGLERPNIKWCREDWCEQIDGVGETL